MDTHKNAPFTPEGRMRMVNAVLKGQSVLAVALAFRVTPKTVRKWVCRFKDGQGLADASCRPRHSPTRIAKGTAQRIVSLRRRRWTMERIAQALRVGRATVARTLARAGLSHLASLDPVPLAIRYERKHPGDLLHIDTKKLGRILKVGHRITRDPRDTVPGAGWEFAFSLCR